MFLSGCCSSPCFEQKRLLMGTEVGIKIFPPPAANSTVSLACEKAFEEIKRVENIASFFDKKSELSILNSAASLRPVQVSDELFYLIEKGLWMSELSGGAFDITAVSLGQKGGYKKIILDKAAGTVFFTDENCKIDLGAYAKGYAVDRAVEVLRSYGIEKSIVDAGGDVRLVGLPTNKKFWEVGIRNPESPKEILKVLKIDKEAAVVTSGNYLRKHIVSLTNREEDVLSVTVIAPTATEADLLSTACFNMERPARLKVMENFDNIEAVVVMKNRDGSLEMSKE